MESEPPKVKKLTLRSRPTPSNKADASKEAATITDPEITAFPQQKIDLSDTNLMSLDYMLFSRCAQELDVRNNPNLVITEATLWHLSSSSITNLIVDDNHPSANMVKAFNASRIITYLVRNNFIDHDYRCDFSKLTAVDIKNLKEKFIHLMQDIGFDIVQTKSTDDSYIQELFQTYIDITVAISRPFLQDQQATEPVDSAQKKRPAETPTEDGEKQDAADDTSGNKRLQVSSDMRLSSKSIELSDYEMNTLVEEIFPTNEPLEAYTVVSIGVILW